MNNNQNVPKVRFKGFNDAWEQRKLGDIANRITRKNQNLEATRPLTISAQYGLIDQNEFFDKRIASKDVSGYYLLKKGEFAYNKSYSGDAPWGAVKRLDRYENGVLSTLYIVFELNENANIDSDFVVTYYATDRWYKEVQAIAAEGARNHGLLNISPNDFFETVLTIPKSVEEQQQIGTYFRNLDNLITLHQRKCDTLQKLKKSMLQKMFPKNGESVPEIRFKGFTDAWEQRKLIEMLIQPITDGPHETPELVDTGIPFISVDAIIDNKIDFTRKRGFITEEYNELCCKKYKPMLNDVYLVKSGSTVGKVAIVETTQLFNIWSPLAAMRCNSNSNPYFLYFLLQTQDLQDQVFDKASHGTQPNLSMRQLEKFDICIPDNIYEQQQIGSYFRNLDNLITLHQRKLQDLQGIKKALLQKMFI